MKYHIDLKFVIEATDPDDTQIKLKQILSKILLTEDLDIFLKNPSEPGYARLKKEPKDVTHITQLSMRKPSNQRLFNKF